MPALLEKLVVNLSSQPDEARAFVARVFRFTDSRDTVREIDDLERANGPVELAGLVPLVGQAERIRSAAVEIGHFPDASAEMLDGMLRAGVRLHPVSELICEVYMRPAASQLAAKTKLWPRSNERIAELAFWGLFDWAMLALQSPGGGQALVRQLIKCLSYQCALYTTRGLPGIRDLGKAAFEAFERLPAMRMAFGPPLFGQSPSDLRDA